MEWNTFFLGVTFFVTLFLRDVIFNDLYLAKPVEEEKGSRSRLGAAVVDEDDLDYIPGGNPPSLNRKMEVDDFFDDDDDSLNKFSPKGADLNSGPGSRISSAKFTGPTIRFLYCTTSGYRNAYDQFVTILQDKHPELFVEGSTYPPPNFNRIGSQILNIIKYVLIGSVLLNQYSLLHLIGIPIAVTNWMTENKVYAGLLFFFFSNFLETQLLATGAFEIYMDDVPIWSKLQTGRVPSPPELLQIIENQLKMGGREPGIEGFKL
jgi:selT/selW/selH-like putative selenoprotein